MGIRENPFYGNFYAVSPLANYEFLNLHSKTAFQKCLSSFKNCYPKLIYCIPDSLIIFQNCFLELFYYNPNLLKI